MEFGDKLQELRKSREMTQEELAEALFVSRTAISKWESGRGYPSIDSLKEISAFFSISIDDLLSGEKLLDIAQKENKSNQSKDGIIPVNLLEYVDRTRPVIWAYWILTVLMIMIGAVKILLCRIKSNKFQRFFTRSSIALGIILVFVMALTRQTYGVAVVFCLFVIKGILLFNMIISHDKI